MSNGITYRKLCCRNIPDLEITHVHHAGNSSGVVDGAAAVLLASPDYAKAQGWKPRARIVAMAQYGRFTDADAERAGAGGEQGAEKAGLTIDDIDLFEINEAFAVVAEKFIRDLDTRSRQGQRQRRRHGAGPPDRRHRRDADRHRAG